MWRALFTWRNVGLTSPRRPLRLIETRTLHHRSSVQTILRRPFHFTSSHRKDEPKIQLRPYQEESIQAVLDHLDRGEKRLGISLATGSGKTVIFSHLIDRIPAPSPDATQTLILAHRKELVQQAAEHCRKLYPDKTIDIEMSNQHASGIADITIASVASITRNRLDKYDPKRFKLILVDEAHHIVASGYLDILRHFQLVDVEKFGSAALVGVSATFARHDGVRLGTAIDHIVYHKDYVDMIEDNYLSRMVFTTVNSKANLSKVKTVGNDFQLGQLSEAVNNSETNTITIRSWLAKAENRRSTLVFCVDLAHVAALTAEFIAHGVDARFVTSDTAQKDRDERVKAFRRGEFPVLLNCGIFTEGTDIPNIDCVVMARPTQSRNLLVQMIGRGLRKYEGKENCHVIDMVASLETGIVTTPTLFGLDPNELLEDADYREMKSRKERKDAEKQRAQQAQEAGLAGGKSRELTGDITFTDYDDVNDLIADTSGERHIRKLSPYGWTQVADDKYILPNRDGEFLRIQKQEGGDLFIVTITRKLPQPAKQPFQRPKQISDPVPFEQAIQAADTAASEVFPFDFIALRARWRKYPASSGQIDFLNKFRGEDEKLEYGSITKGKAGDWITKIKHGARGRFNRYAAQKKSAERKVAKQEQRQNRGLVTAGPVKW